MSRLNHRCAAALVVVGVLLLAACGKKDELKGDVVKDAAPCTSTVTLPASAKPADPGKAKTPSSLVNKDVKVGTGCDIASSTYVGVQYVGVVAATGKQFATTWGDRTPLEFQLGKSQVIKGWEQGLSGMKVGGRRQLTVPAKLAYGAAGLPSLGIPKNAALEFVIDLVSVTDAPTVCRAATDIPAAKGKPTTIAMPKIPPKDLVSKDLKVGTGAAAKKTSYVTVNYVGVACSSGTQFDSSWDRGETFPLQLGQGQVIPGWDQGIPGMKVGGTRQLDIPASLAYSTAGQGNIGPNEPLVFVIQLLAVSSKPPATTTTVPPATTAAPTTAASASTTTTSATTTTTAPASGSTTSTTAAKH
ncbi:MAG TPA: FKBP-type peptidyl-prolyl cis-trans isomerase [Acidimicrobiales bacterium]